MVCLNVVLFGLRIVIGGGSWEHGGIVEGRSGVGDVSRFQTRNSIGDICPHNDDKCGHLERREPHVVPPLSHRRLYIAALPSPPPPRPSPATTLASATTPTLYTSRSSQPYPLTTCPPRPPHPKINAKSTPCYTIIITINVIKSFTIQHHRAPMPPARANTFGPTMHVPASFQQQQVGHPMGAGGVGGVGGMHNQLMDGNRSVVSSLSAGRYLVFAPEGGRTKKGTMEGTQVINFQTAYAAVSRVSSLHTFTSTRQVPPPCSS